MCITDDSSGYRKSGIRTPRLRPATFDVARHAEEIAGWDTPAKPDTKCVETFIAPVAKNHERLIGLQCTHLATNSVELRERDGFFYVLG